MCVQKTEDNVCYLFLFCSFFHSQTSYSDCSVRVSEHENIEKKVFHTNLRYGGLTKGVISPSDCIGLVLF